VNIGTMGVNSLPKTVTRQRRGCDLNPGRSAPESSTLTTLLPSHPKTRVGIVIVLGVLWSCVHTNCGRFSDFEGEGTSEILHYFGGKRLARQKCFLKRGLFSI